MLRQKINNVQISTTSTEEDFLVAVGIFRDTRTSICGYVPIDETSPLLQAPVFEEQSEKLADRQDPQVDHGVYH
jgi:hypothetical protein